MDIKFRALVIADSKKQMLTFNIPEMDNGLWAWPIDKSVEHIDEYISPLMQYTGLNDKNGKEIYEGDILNYTLANGEIRLYKIWREKGGLVINIHQDDFFKPIDKINFYEACADMQSASFIEGNLVVIGNVYEA